MGGTQDRQEQDMNPHRDKNEKNGPSNFYKVVIQKNVAVHRAMHILTHYFPCVLCV